MLARLPAERIAAHSAEIQQLRPLLDKVHGKSKIPNPWTSDFTEPLLLWHFASRCGCLMRSQL
jgi:hypothetical protein